MRAWRIHRRNVHEGIACALWRRYPCICTRSVLFYEKIGAGGGHRCGKRRHGRPKLGYGACHGDAPGPVKERRWWRTEARRRMVEGDWD